MLHFTVLPTLTQYHFVPQDGPVSQEWWNTYELLCYQKIYPYQYEEEL